MANMVYPNPAMRSVTAAPNLGDQHDNHIYSAAVLAHGGSGMAKLFSVQFGQSIPELKLSTITATANAHQTTYTLTTTNLDRPSQLGDNIGDATLRALGVTIETAAITITTSTARTFGATQFELNDILSKCAGELKIGGKSQITGPIFTFPAVGGLAGSIAATGTAATVAIAQNGALPIGRELRTPMLLGRYDAFVFELSVANGASLAFSNTGTDGQPTLVWAVILADLMSDVR